MFFRASVLVKALTGKWQRPSVDRSSGIVALFLGFNVISIWIFDSKRLTPVEDGFKSGGFKSIDGEVIVVLDRNPSLNISTVKICHRRHPVGRIWTFPSTEPFEFSQDSLPLSPSEDRICSAN